MPAHTVPHPASRTPPHATPHPTPSGNRSLSVMLSLALSTVIAAFALLHTAWTYVVATSEIHQLLDRRLQEVAARVSDDMARAMNPLHLYRDASDGIVIQIWLGGTKPSLHPDSDPLTLGREAPPGFSTQTVEQERWRVYSRHGPDWTIHVAQREASRKRIAEDAAIASAMPALAMMPLAWLAIFMTVKRALRRVGALGERAARLDIGHLASLPTDKVPRELLPLVQSINLMIARLSQSLQVEKKFIADAAHELRSPLTSLQIQADNLGRTLSDPHSLREYNALQQVIARSTRMISQLLRLARADAPLERAASQPVAIRDVVPDVIEMHLPRAAAHGIDLGVEQLDDLQVRASLADVRTALSNLVDNALKYTPDGGTIDLRAYRDEGLGCIEVRDTGNGVAPEALPRVFDRFFRADAHGTEGSGLGLAIVKAIAERYGGDASIDNRGDVPSGVVARLRFPLAHR
ncbi:HAMP domain-containing histidine kinase [Cupriavidus gilardii]|uniref:sensor histidine kinase n=1 Tax=Cupriavidus gilardii TaxID=82541 RepID=UPI001ABE2788|nr:HAMP domain-containing sensor histidine kinase [Cupriavidus gilardii]MBO4123483.1 HAMP domain-containing histidine kinase [Cupriavidus gilardii]